MKLTASLTLSAYAIFMYAIEAQAKNADCIFSDTECACSKTTMQGTCLRYTSGSFDNAQCSTQPCNGGGYVCNCDGQDLCSVNECKGWKLEKPNSVLPPVGTEGVPCVYSSGSQCLERIGHVPPAASATTTAPVTTARPTTTAPATTTAAPASTTAASATITTAPATTTKAPSTTTKAPATTTTAPVTTTTAKLSTTAAPTTNAAPWTEAPVTSTTGTTSTTTGKTLSTVKFLCDYSANLYIQGTSVAEGRGWKVVSEWTGVLGKGDMVAILGKNGQSLAGCEVDITWHDSDESEMRTVSTFNVNAWRASCNTPRTAVAQVDQDHCTWNNAVQGQCDKDQALADADCIWAADCANSFSEIAIKTVLGEDNAGC